MPNPPDPKLTRDPFVARIGRVLDALGSAAEPLRLSDLTRSLNLPKTTVWRLLSALTAEGFVRRVSGSYILGDRLLDLTSATIDQHALRSAAVPHLVDLHASTGASVMLTVVSGSTLRVVECIYGRGADALWQTWSEASPAADSVFGRFLLACAPCTPTRPATLSPSPLPLPRPVGEHGGLAWMMGAVGADEGSVVAAVAAGIAPAKFHAPTLGLRLQQSITAISAALCRAEVMNAATRY